MDIPTPAISPQHCPARGKAQIHFSQFWHEPIATGIMEKRRSMFPGLALPTSSSIVTESWNLGWKRSLNHWVQTLTNQHLAKQIMARSVTIQSFLEHLQRQWLHHLPGQYIPTFKNPFHEEILHDVWVFQCSSLQTLTLYWTAHRCTPHQPQVRKSFTQ